MFLTPRELLKFMARPKLKDNEVRNIDTTIAFNQCEFARVSARSKLAGKRLAEFVRLRALDDSNLKIIREINQESAQMLREILNLLTQFALYIEQQQMPFLDPIFFLEMQKDLRQMHHDFLNYGND